MRPGAVRRPALPPVYFCNTLSRYEQVCELREKRLDQEDVLADLQKAVEALKKDHEALVKKERVIDAALNASESEIREFQSHKQQELNKLDTVVALKMHQVTLRCVLFILV